jgi:predicted nucleic acid-binding protein
MTRVALDSNVLIYAEIEPETDKGRRAADIILRAAKDGVIPIQALGEYLRFVQRRAPHVFKAAVAQAELYRETFVTPSTTEAVLAAAAELGKAHQVQLRDGVICAAASQAGAVVLLTEDMQDGGSIGALRLINPFASANDAAIDTLIPK